LLAERGIDVDRVTVYRWVQTFDHARALSVVRRSEG
jgi:transposase-like protein